MMVSGVDGDHQRWSVDAGAFGTAASLCLPFAALLALLGVVAPPSVSQRSAADPLVQLLGRAAPWLTVAGAVLVAIVWAGTARPKRSDVVRALAGAGAAVIIAVALRTLVGDRLPSFIPPEESSGPGVTLGLAAGLLEEVVFRLVLLPGAYFACRKKLDALGSAAAAIVATSALFSLGHELGPAGGVFELRFMLTRFLIPGVAMSLLAFRPGPSFLVSAHCTAHLLIPVLFHRDG